MKFLSSIVVIAFIAYVQAGAGMSEEQMAKAHEIRTQCAADFKLSPEEMTKMKSGDFANVSQQNKCFTKCVLEKYGVIDANGKLNERAAVEKLAPMTNQATAETGVNQCKTVTGSDPCDFAFKFFECTSKLKLM